MKIWEAIHYLDCYTFHDENGNCIGSVHYARCTECGHDQDLSDMPQDVECGDCKSLGSWEPRKYATEIELMADLAKQIKDVNRITILPENVLSVEYNHNGWRDEFRSVEQLVAELQKQHRLE